MDFTHETPSARASHIHSFTINNLLEYHVDGEISVSEKREMPITVNHAWTLDVLRREKENYSRGSIEENDASQPDATEDNIHAPTRWRFRSENARVDSRQQVDVRSLAELRSLVKPKEQHAG